MTLPANLIAYLQTLTLTGGDHDGQPFTVLPWEKRFVHGAFRTRRDAALTVGRGNGKSAIVAGIASAVVDPTGPLHGRRREVVCVASSFQQGRIIYDDVQAFLREKYDLGKRRDWRVQDSANVAVLEHKPTGARVRTVGSDPKRLHGLRPVIVLADEPAQWEPSKANRARAALRTSLGKVPGSRLIGLGTRPADSTHWFAAMLRNRSVYVQAHAANPDDPPFQRRTWRKANPSLDHLPSLLAEIIDEAADARKDPAELASFRALRLNQGTSDTERQELIGAATWRKCEGVADMAGPCAWGVDLGGSAAFSAIAAYWPLTGALRCLAMIGDDPTLAVRGIADGVGGLYVSMERRGELRTWPGRVASVAALLSEAMREWGRPDAICADRWREGELRDALADADVPMARLVLRGMGFKDGGEDVRLFRKAVLDGAVTPEPSLLLRSAMGEAVTMSDPAGNAKLAKQSEGGRRVRARDDAAAAAILAVAEGARREAGPSEPEGLRLVQV